jgi:hypothetical protein
MQLLLCPAISKQRAFGGENESIPVLEANVMTAKCPPSVIRGKIIVISKRQSSPHKRIIHTLIQPTLSAFQSRRDHKIPASLIVKYLCTYVHTNMVGD